MSATPGSGAAPEDEKKPNEQHINLKVKGQHPPHYLYVEERMKESHQRAFDLPFICSRIVHPRQGKLSYYNPSCLMMDYIVHAINKTLSDSFYFKRANPDYHPYILRLYYGVMFWVQCLRAGNDVYALTNDQQEFLTWFLDYNPPETLPIAGPLLGLFKTLCSSQPEFPYYGKVYPRIPTHPGPRRRDEFMRSSIECNFLPNVPGIFALLEDLNQSFTSDPPIYPKLGRHIPVTENAAVLFGHKVFPVNDERTDVEKWSLVSPGLQYPCEADQKLNEMFSERYDDFDFPVTAAGDNLQKISSFLSLKRNFAWFFRVKEVANAAAASFERSGTLADCFPHGLVANQIVVCINDRRTPPAAPTRVADAESLFDFGYRLKSTAQNLPPIAETAAAYAQTHIRMPNNHPYLGLFGTKTDAFGPFWSIRPIGSSSHSDDSSFLIIPSIVRRALKTK